MDDITNTLNQVIFTLYEQPFTVGGLIFTPILLFVGVVLTNWLVKKLVARLIANGANADIVHLVKRITYIIAIIIITITTLDILNVPITAFAFLSGAIAIGVGFGAQNIINNFISGWILMWERPIRIGDFLEVENARGRVESINTRSTRIRRIDGVHMLIPNSKLLENTVVNWTLIDTLTRTMVKVGVAYGSPATKVKELINQAVTDQDDILKDPAPVVLFEDFGDNALVFETYFWINATVDRDLRVIRSNVRFAIDELFAEHGIVIAFPQRDIHVDGQLQLVSNSDSKQHKETL
ncbi:mechanosensitive ion channel family protein [Paraglaciecola sp. 2405UD69-4]|uniref:mechanosensitive ion channel family protein n=1 Tax=Paraglaciecola sp. 2405UD69-4 TaxID=3391836 RepID=UPI0039C8D8AE